MTDKKTKPSTATKPPPGREIISELARMIGDLSMGRMGYHQLVKELRQMAERIEQGSPSAPDAELDDVRKARLASAQRIYLAWVKATGRDVKRNKLTPKRKEKCLARLRRFTEAELIAVVRAQAEDAFLGGDNEHGRRYDDLELMLRNEERVEEWLEKASPEALETAGVVDGDARAEIEKLEVEAQAALDADDVRGYEQRIQQIKKLKGRQ